MKLMNRGSSLWGGAGDTSVTLLREGAPDSSARMSGSNSPPFLAGLGADSLQEPRRGGQQMTAPTCSALLKLNHPLRTPQTRPTHPWEISAQIG